jgi:hypothetical protein
MPMGSDLACGLERIRFRPPGSATGTVAPDGSPPNHEYESLPADTVEGLTELYQFTDFRHFVEVWVMTTNCLRTADDFRQVVVDYARQAGAQGPVYLEGIFSPAERVEASGIDWGTRSTQATARASPRRRNGSA